MRRSRQKLPSSVENTWGLMAKPLCASLPVVSRLLPFRISYEDGEGEGLSGAVLQGVVWVQKLIAVLIIDSGGKFD